MSDHDESDLPPPADAEPTPLHEVEMENGYRADVPATADVPEDDATFLQPATRAVKGEEDELAAVEGESPSTGEGPPVESAYELTSDAEGIADDAEPRTEEPAGGVNWQREMSAHRIAVELKRIETEVRSILAEKDPKRKRRLAGTRRWQELEEDVLSWHWGGRFDEAALGRLHQLIVRRHYLFRHLTFVTSTRPTWNT